MSENKLRLVKELLESFKANREVHEPFVMSFEEETDKALEWAIKQVERVQELEEECAGWKEASRFNDEKLEQQNKRYREFIETVSDNWLIAGKIKIEVEGISIITPHHLLNWINKEANKLLEESK